MSRDVEQSLLELDLPISRAQATELLGRKVYQMKRKWFRMIVLAGVTVASSIVVADDGPTIVIPMPPPASRPSEADASVVTDAQSEVDNAQKLSQAARAELVQAKANLKSVTCNLQRQLESGSTLVEATKSTAAAKAAYEELAQPIFASLLQRPEYRDARDAVAAAQRTSAGVSARVGASTEERIAAAQAVLSAKAAVAKFETEALENNPDIVNARKNYLEAAQRHRELRAQLWQAVREHPAYVAASQTVDAARERAAAADQELAAVYKDLSAAHRRLDDKLEARRQLDDWTYRHGLPDAP